MNRYEIQYRPDGKWWCYTITCNGIPQKGGIVRTKSAAVKQAETEVKKLQRAA